MTAAWGLPEIEELASRLLAARRDGLSIDLADLPVPPTLAVAEAVQARVALASAHDGAGWKLAIGSDGMPCKAPLYPFLRAGAMPIEVIWRKGLGIEVELAFRLSPGAVSDDSARLPEMIDEVWLGVELVRPRVNASGPPPHPLFIADGMENDGYVLGPTASMSSRDRVAAGEVGLVVEGAANWSGVARHPRADPLAPLANALLHAAIAPSGGIVYTTGSLCGILPIDGPGMVAITFDAKIRLEIAFI